MNTHSGLRIKLTIDEVISLCSLLEIPAFPGVDEAIIDGLEASEHDERIASGGRSLIARDLIVLSDTDDAVAVQGELADLLERIAGPVISVFAFRLRREAADARFWHVAERDVLEQCEDGNGVLLFESRPIADARASFRAFICLDGRRAPVEPSFTLTERALFEIGTSQGGHAGASPGFVAALTVSGGVSLVEAAYADDGRLGPGGRVAWVDGGEHGCWLVERIEALTENGDAVLAISPEDTDAIAARIAACVPEMLPSQ